MTTPDYVIVLTTVPAHSDAVRLATTLVEEKLAACINIQADMQSVYRWDERIEQDLERQVVIKTTRARVLPLWERLRELHPYDVPEFLVLPVIDGSEAYLRWMQESTASGTADAADA